MVINKEFDKITCFSVRLYTKVKKNISDKSKSA